MENGIVETNDALAKKQEQQQKKQLTMISN